MDLLFNLLLVLHLLALVVGTATAVAMPLVMRRMAAAGPESRELLGGIAARLGANSRIALGVLIATGVAMVWTRYGGTEGMSGWFWAKMSLVALVVALMAASTVLPRNAVSPRLIGQLMRLSLIGIIVAAVFAFN